MYSNPEECPEHVWASIGIAEIEGTVHRIWDCERCPAWTDEPLTEDRRVPRSETGLGP